MLFTGIFLYCRCCTKVFRLLVLSCSTYLRYYTYWIHYFFNTLVSEGSGCRCQVYTCMPRVVLCGIIPTLVNIHFDTQCIIHLLVPPWTVSICESQQCRVQQAPHPLSMSEGVNSVSWGEWKRHEFADFYGERSRQSRSGQLYELMDWIRVNIKKR